ncbi:MAG TPA: hypothetical protein PLQ39_12655, partial [Acinetobacter sp.]|nr:hypothetical protein [Acinetobacter sp.]
MSLVSLYQQVEQQESIDIPSGWNLCDGTNGTPDLRDKFIVGASQDEGGIAKTNILGTLTKT